MNLIQIINSSICISPFWVLTIISFFIMILCGVYAERRNNNPFVKYIPAHLKGDDLLALVYRFKILIPIVLFFGFCLGFSEVLEEAILFIFILTGFLTFLIIFFIERARKACIGIFIFGLIVSSMWAIKIINNMGSIYWYEIERKSDLNPEEAKKLFHRATELNLDIEDFIKKAVVLNKLELIKEARNEVNKVISLNPKDISGYSFRVVLSMKLGDYNDALKDINILSTLIDRIVDDSSGSDKRTYIEDLRKSRHFLRFFRSKSLMGMGQYEEALKEIDLVLNVPIPKRIPKYLFNDEVLHIVETLPEAYYLKSSILSKLGRKLEADSFNQIGKEMELLGMKAKYVLPYFDLLPYLKAYRYP